MARKKTRDIIEGPVMDKLLRGETFPKTKQKKETQDQGESMMAFAPMLDIKRRDKRGKKYAKIRGVYFNNVLWEKLRQYAQDHETSITKILERLTEDFLRKQQQK